MNYWKNERIELRAFEESDALFFKECLDLYEMQYGNCDIRFPMSLKACEKLIEEFTEIDNNDPEGQFLVIMDNEKNNVGMIDVHNVDVKVGCFEYGISILPKYRRRGFAKNAIKMLIRYFFYERRFQKVNVGIYNFNEESVKLHEEIGFVYEGKIRRNFYCEGNYYDTLMYGMTIEEFHWDK